MTKLNQFLSTPLGKVINTALYLAGSAAITALVDYITQIDMAGQPILYATIVQGVNLVLVAVKQTWFAKK